ncbi:unnamed protein product [Lactuca virosa]|uniref:Uncharacterized protein n=1 Tax=Lactuca virosa TaxID=75947 RepID=A0AAU9N0F9_9ASTR|nr:unnamed protein product [Lactuca virosa]
MVSKTGLRCWQKITPIYGFGSFLVIPSPISVCSRPLITDLGLSESVTADHLFAFFFCRVMKPTTTDVGCFLNASTEKNTEWLVVTTEEDFIIATHHPIHCIALDVVMGFEGEFDYAPQLVDQMLELGLRPYAVIPPPTVVDRMLKDLSHVIFETSRFATTKEMELNAERVVLNLMQRMSCIATLTKAMVEAANPACILETTKTVLALCLQDNWELRWRQGHLRK